jgi:hypothetical protein
MSVIDELPYVIVTIIMLAASLALSDPGLGLAPALKREPVTHYSLQSCP